jgi:hypothetical protein
VLGRKSKHVERLPVTCLRANTAVEPRHSFHIVIEYVRRGVQHARDRIQIAAEIGRQYLKASCRQRLLHLPDSFGEMRRAAVPQIVAIHARDDDVSQLHPGRHTSDVRRLEGVELHLVNTGVAFWHGTKTASPGAKIPENHEGRCAPVEAVVNIRTPGRFAHRVQIQGA